jgi:O-methyltransferase
LNDRLRHRLKRPVARALTRIARLFDANDESTAIVVSRVAAELRAQIDALKQDIVASEAGRLDRMDEQLSQLQTSAEGLHTRLTKLRKDMGRPWSLANCEPEPEFLELAREVHEHATTGLEVERLYVLWQVAKNVRGLPGSAAEVGTYRGGSAYFIARSLKHFDQNDPELHVIDTFQGHPAERLTPKDTFHPAGKFSDTSFDSVRDYLSAFPRVQVHMGEFSRRSKLLPDEPYRFAHIDTDLYRPTLDGLRFFGERLVQGGIIVVDDYGAEKCLPVVEAVSKYLYRHDEFSVWDVMTEQIVLVRK